MSPPTVDSYLAALSPERREMVDALRKAVLHNLDAGYIETIQYGMIGYAVPHGIFPAGYHCDPKQPLPFAAIASQKNHVSLYLMGLYCGCDGAAESDDVRWLRQAWISSGKKKLDMGKACLRFKKLDDIAFDVIGEAIARLPAARFIARYQESLAAPRPPRNKS